MRKPVIGLLPLYLELYDQVVPELRKDVEAFALTIKKEFEKLGLTVIAAPVCRIKKEFAKAVKVFEEKNVAAIVTLHLAYSPSLESAEILAKTKLPLIILDTTPDFDFGFSTTPDKIMMNHGIHGVQDLCNLLLRKGKHFMIETGHWQKSDVITRVLKNLKACIAANAMKSAQVGIIGKPFCGMGDFAIPFIDLKKSLGFEIIQSSASDFKSFRHSTAEIRKEVDFYLKTFNLAKGSGKNIQQTAKTSLSVRKWIEKKKLSAFTFNFLDIDKKCGLETVPFLEASLGMTRGVGYAGEGDVMTAALVASLAKIFAETTFTEMFCPDWKGNKVFLSHMGEVNTNLLNGKAEIVEMNLPFLKASFPPIIPHGCLKPGNAAILNLAPGPNDSFTLIACCGNVHTPEKTEMAAIGGWFEPEKTLADFLAEYSIHGGTHHSALVYNPDLKVIHCYAKIMEWNFVSI